MDKYYNLKEKIKNSNLSELDKKTLNDILSQEKIDMNSFLLAFFRLLKVGKMISNFFDTDIGD
jgi:hypothetical protein